MRRRPDSFLQATHDDRGARIALAYFALLTAVTGVRSFIDLFVPDGRQPPGPFR